jgi:hypothetical protein
MERSTTPDRYKITAGKLDTGDSTLRTEVTMFWEALLFFTAAYLVVVFAQSAWSGLMYYVDEGNREHRIARRNSIRVAVRYLLRYGTLAGGLLVAAVVMVVPNHDGYSSSSGEVHHERLTEPPGNLTGLIRQYASSGIPSSRAARQEAIMVIEWALFAGPRTDLSSYMYTEAYQKSCVPGLRLMLNGLLEYDVVKYRDGCLLVDDWFTWRDANGEAVRASIP